MSYFHPKFIFPGQHDGEQVYLVIRSHWLFLLSRLLLWLILVGVYVAISILQHLYADSLNLSSRTWDILAIIKDVYLLLILLGAFLSWIMYYLNVQIVTSERIVDITQYSLLNHTISELHLSRIQDITSEINGALPTFFNFGNLYIQTAAEKERFTFDNIPNPTELEKLISGLCDKNSNAAKTQNQDQI